MIGTQHTVTATHLDEFGRGVADINGLSVLVANLLPEETGLVAIEHVSRQRPIAIARLLNRSVNSPDRVTPACPAAGVCGGCAWQHWRYPRQIEGKRQRVVAALAARGLSVAVAPVEIATAILGYRNKGKYVISGRGGAIVLGAYKPRTHEVVSTLGCAVVSPSIDRAAGELAEALSDSGLSPYNEHTGRGCLRHVLIRAGADNSVILCLVTAESVATEILESIGTSLIERGTIAGLSVSVNAHPGNALLVAPATPIVGRASVAERIGPVELDLGIEEFWQVNRAQAAHLIEHVAALYSGGSAVDLYGGVGGFAIALAMRGASVTCVELSEPSVKSGRMAIARARLKGAVHYVAGDATSAEQAVASADFVVVNPPRKGLSNEIKTQLLSALPSALVYVSCGPESLARDLAELSSGYEIRGITPFDLMPGTAQIEILVELRPRKV